MEIQPIQDPLFRFFHELDKVQDNERSLVLLTSGFIELLIETLVKARCKHAKRITQDGKTYSFATKLLLLNEKDVLDDETYACLELVRKLRNRAAHEAFFSVSTDELKALQKATGELDGNLQMVCSTAMATLWNTQGREFSSIFAPQALERLKENRDLPLY